MDENSGLWIARDKDKKLFLYSVLKPMRSLGEYVIPSSPKPEELDVRPSAVFLGYENYPSVTFNTGPAEAILLAINDSELETMIIKRIREEMKKRRA